MNTTCKKALFLMALAFMAIAAAAQSTCDVIFLKDKTFVKGTIIEQIPNEMLKVQTEDGKVHSIRLADIEKITQETLEESKRPSNHKKTSGGQALQRGYRGLVDAGFCLNTGYHVGNRMELSTSHGYQFNRHTFVGLGVGMHYFFDSDKVNIPIFAHARYDFADNAFTPFAELKIGYSAGAYDGFFGPGTGSFFIIMQHLVLRMGLVRASATAKVFNLASNAGAFAVFATGGVTHFMLGLPLAAANILGNQLGTRLAIRIGARMVRNFLYVTLTLLLSTLVYRFFLS